MNQKILNLLAIVLFLSLVSCSKGEVYFSYNQINRGIWHRDSVLTFTMDSIKFNPIALHDFSIELTTADVYPFKDIWLQVEHNLNDSIFLYDTLYTRLAGDYGEWLGGGTAGLYQLSLPYKSSVVLDTSNIYMLHISHLMLEDPLYGVERIGLKVIENI